MTQRNAWIILGLLLCLSTNAGADEPPLGTYFREETAKIASQPLLGIQTAEEWKSRRPELQRQLLEMLGLDPLPEKTDLQARITGTVEQPDFVVENLLFQSRPGLYVTGNLYRPKDVTEPLPAILYVCGHANVVKNGVIYGNKAHYQHHAEWYAANGYVCLVVDTLQLGELPGLHHGTYREGMWWWQSRGYTSAGVEAWNGVRAIDYLISRPEVDKERIGVTGRSGGGATSWWLGAIDDRVSAVVPVAGITDLRNHVVAGNPDVAHPNGVIEGHCDCMYFINTYRWDFTVLAALVAPKALLIENTDKDPIFPEAGVRRIYDQLKTVYGWYDAREKLDIVIGSGGHVDSEEIRHPSFAFFEKWLKGKDVPLSAIEEPDRKLPIENLKVLKPDEVPPGNQNDTIHETFVAKAEPIAVPSDSNTWNQLQKQLKDQLRTRVFPGWPSETGIVPLDLQVSTDRRKDGSRLRAVEFTSQDGVRLTLWLLTHADDKELNKLTAEVVDQDTWEKRWSWLAEAPMADSFRPRSEAEANAFHLYRDAFENQPGNAIAIIAPRGVGPTSWDAKKDTHIRRRFALLGQTLAGMQAWDTRRAVAALQEVEDVGDPKMVLCGQGAMSTVALMAAIFEPQVTSVILSSPPESVRQGPALLNLERFMEMPQVVALMAPRSVVLYTDHASAWKWTSALSDTLGGESPFLRIASKESD